VRDRLRADEKYKPFTVLNCFSYSVVIGVSYRKVIPIKEDLVA